MKPRFLFALLMLGAALTTSCAQAGRLADVTIYDRSDGRALPVYWHKGKAYVVGKPGNEYQISLRNRADRDVLAVVSVDGVNVVSGKTASADQEGYVYEAGTEYAIAGWRKSTEQTAAFYFTSLADSYAARTGRPSNVGVIGIALFQRKAPPVVVFQQEDRNARTIDEQAAPSASAEMRKENSRIGTGHGRIESSPVSLVDFERATTRPEEVVTIYYDSYANLVARGVIRSTQPAKPATPQPFPADVRFVPDPPRR